MDQRGSLYTAYTVAVFSNDGIGGKPYVVKQHRPKDISTDGLDALILKLL